MDVNLNTVVPHWSNWYPTGHGLMNKNFEIETLYIVFPTRVKEILEFCEPSEIESVVYAVARAKSFPV